MQPRTRLIRIEKDNILIEVEGKGFEKRIVNAVNNI
jgi:hypothetical protein